MKFILFVIIYMFYILAWYYTVYLALFDVFYIQWLYSACKDLFEYTKEIWIQLLPI